MRELFVIRHKQVGARLGGRCDMGSDKRSISADELSVLDDMGR